MSPHISGAHFVATNDRFGDANATGRSYQRHLSAKQEFPFTYEVRTDPLTGAVDGLMKRCLASGTCPKIVHTDSGNEPYLKPLLLVTTDGPGNGAIPTDLVLPTNVRVCTIGNSQHAPASGPSITPSGVCQRPGNPNDWAPYVKTLGTAMDDWVTASVAPPPSRYARVDDGTLVHSLPQSESGFPSSPAPCTGVMYTGRYNTVDVLDRSVLPPMPIRGKSYTILVPKTDVDGNGISGVRTLDVQVPVENYTGWGLRRAHYAANGDCALTGQYIPFKATQSDHERRGPDASRRQGGISSSVAGGAGGRLAEASKLRLFDVDPPFDARSVPAVSMNVKPAPLNVSTRIASAQL